MNYHSLKLGPDPKGIAESVKKALEICQEQNINELAIAVHTKEQLKANTIVKVIGENNIKVLAKNNHVSLGDIEIFLITERIDPNQFTSGPILAIDISSKLLKKLINDHRATDLIFKPWTEEELEEYIDLLESEPI